MTTRRASVLFYHEPISHNALVHPQKKPRGCTRTRHTTLYKAYLTTRSAFRSSRLHSSLNHHSIRSLGHQWLRKAKPRPPWSVESPLRLIIKPSLPHPPSREDDHHFLPQVHRAKMGIQILRTRMEQQTKTTKTPLCPKSSLPYWL